MLNLQDKIPAALAAFLTLAAGCAPNKSTDPSDIKGGMTSGSWGVGSNGVYANCSVQISRAAATDDEALKVARIDVSGIGAAQWYYVAMGNAQQPLETLEIDGNFHSFQSPLLLDGSSNPVTEQKVRIGSIALTATGNDTFTGELTWQRPRHSSSTVARLDCTRKVQLPAFMINLSKCVSDPSPTSQGMGVDFYIKPYHTGLRTITVVQNLKSGGTQTIGEYNGATQTPDNHLFYRSGSKTLQLDLFINALNGKLNAKAIFNNLDALGSSFEDTVCQ